MAPDLDVFIKSSYDPLLSLEYHRQFTHSFIFIPFGAIIVTLFTYYFFKKYITFFENYIFAFIGYSTHALLDACTSYGTQLLWPFSNYRFAWNSVSIIDPLLTIPILLLMFLAVILKNKFLMNIDVFKVKPINLGGFQRFFNSFEAPPTLSLIHI